jgi:hypothetical protein
MQESRADVDKARAALDAATAAASVEVRKNSIRQHTSARIAYVSIRQQE